MIRTHISSFFLAYIIVLTIVAIFVECLFLKVLLGIELKADGVIISLWAAILVIIAFVLYIIISLIRELYYATRVVKIDDDNLYVHYMLHPAWDYTLPLKDFDSYFTTKKRLIDRFKINTIYLCKGNETHIFVEDLFLKNYEQLLKVVENRYPWKKVAVTKSRHQLWRGGCASY